MSRDQRITDNHALIHAQNHAKKEKLPLAVLFNIRLNVGHRSQEHYKFMIDGLKQIESACQKKNIIFILTIGNPKNEMLAILKDLNPKYLVLDFSPLKGPKKIQSMLISKLNCEITIVDTHNIIPAWVLSNKEEYAAHTIRNKIYKKLKDWLIEPEKITKHPYQWNREARVNDWEKVRALCQKIVSNGSMIKQKSGEVHAMKTLKDFIDNRLDNYAISRNDPTIDGQSNLSPFLHYGQISSLRIILEILKICDDEPLLFKKGKLASFEGAHTKLDSINAFFEELIVRKELADNFCFYSDNYQSKNGFKKWAYDSLEAHKKDTREFIYSINELIAKKTHDKAWNAAQSEMMQTGKMHGYMRMYWAKKILEWSTTVDEALEKAIYLNDHYSIDGGDPNGYTGIMWSIGGTHDRPWFDRPIFGKIRYMNDQGLNRRFNVEKYISNWLE
tara:strand:+ start:516 stop:1850 length:1335 start_codon:yes stop_codon:yes gene_type:complete